jgi:hypothetical protein
VIRAALRVKGASSPFPGDRTALARLSHAVPGGRSGEPPAQRELGRGGRSSLAQHARGAVYRLVLDSPALSAALVRDQARGEDELAAVLDALTARLAARQTGPLAGGLVPDRGEVNVSAAPA